MNISHASGCRCSDCIDRENRAGFTAAHAPAAPSVGKPDGWRFVPVEPTEAMLEADWNVSLSDAHTDHGVAYCAWAAMLAAAPAAQPFENLEQFPAGWKPMPVDPTREMKAAGAEATGMGHDLAHHCWSVMAAKALAAPVASHAQEAPDFWPIAKLTVDDAGEVTAASLYAPGLPAGVHDVYPESTAYEYARGRADERAALAASGAPHARLAMQLALDALTCASGHDECESLERCAVEALRAALVTKVASQGADHGR